MSYPCFSKFSFIDERVGDEMLHMNALRAKEITLTRENEGIMQIDGTPVMMPAKLHVKIVEDGLKVLVKKRF